jgi:hypothetical protein
MSRIAPVLVTGWFAVACSSDLGGSDGPGANDGTGGSSIAGDGDLPGDGDGIDADGDGRLDCVPGVRGTSQVPRLKNLEYDNTIRDLLGLTGLTESNNAPPSSLLATDQGGSLSDLGWSSYQTVAQMIAAQVMADPNMKAMFMDCDAADAGCLDTTITDFGRRAFRRPLSVDEVTLLQSLNNPALTENGTPEEIAELILYGFLVSPMFLMRSEVQETTDDNVHFALSPYEVASRLSYTLWGSMPDSTLDEAADAGQLSTKEQILAQATRMLADDKAKVMVADFHRDYLHIDVNTRWDTFVKDPALYPAFNEGLRKPMTQEVERFFEEIVFGNGTFQDLFLSTDGYVNADTAPLYGLDGGAMGADLQPTDLPDRPGFLTRVGFLSAYSAAYRTSPIVRGAFISKEVLGNEPGAPPPGAAQTPLPESPDLDTNRKKVTEQTSGGPCVQCHSKFINPPGFVLESFDTMGVPQTVERDTGAAIETSANVWIDGAAVPVANATELMNKIANSTDAQHFYSQKWVGRAFDRSPNSQDACIVEALTTNIAAGGYSVLQLIADITQADAFSVRTLETGVAQ